MLARNTPDNLQLSLALDARPQVYAVSELNAALQRMLENDFRGIWVAGEISGCRSASSGHYYFALKDDRSQIKAVLFKNSARFVKLKPQDGLAVRARGSLEVYEARGEYQLIVEALEPQGAGVLQLAFEQLKKKLAAEGLFDAERKRKLPRLPRRIGIVTSPDGAVIRDILHVLERRFPGLHIRIFPAQVQGDAAPEQVCRGLAHFSQTPWADVVIVARGGGSLEDLWAFNDERVARAVAASRPPVISAVGHETDFTICDFVADLRAPTPSAAAEIVICTRESLIDSVASRSQRALQSIRYRLLRSTRDWHQKGEERTATLVQRILSRNAQRIDDVDYRLRNCQRKAFETRRRRLGETIRRLEACDLRFRFSRIRSRLELLEQRLHRQIDIHVALRRRREETLTLQLQQLSPLNVLARGYAIVQDENGHALRAARETKPGAALSVRLSAGRLGVHVDTV